MTASTDATIAPEETDWIGISGYLPPCIDGAWEDGAIHGDTAKTLKTVCVYLKSWLNKAHEGEGTAGSPFESWLEGEEIGDARDGDQRLLRWNKRCKAPLPDEEVMEIAHTISLGDRSRFTCKIAKRCPSLAEYCDPQDCRMLANRSFSLGDFGEMVRTKKGERFAFSRSKAATSIRERISLVMTPSSKDIFNFDGEIFKPLGAEAIRNTLYSMCGDDVNRTDVVEVLDRIGAALKLEAVDLRPDPYLMPLQNGVLDLKTGELMEYTPEHKFTFKYGARWDPTGGNWKRVLWHLCSSLKDPRDVLQAIDIMTATAIREPFDSWVLLFGGGANGKGIFQKLLLNFITPERASAITLEELKRSRFGLSGLLGMDLLIVSEVSGVGDTNNVLKKLATGEFLDGDVKYSATRAKGTPHLMQILDANLAFDYGDDSYGRKRRSLKIDFPYTFGDGPDMRPIDRSLKERFKDEDILSGLAWIIAARAPSLIASQKIYRYKSIEETEEEFDRQRNSLHYFTEECLGDNSNEFQGGLATRLTTTEAYEKYLEYCEYFGVPTTVKQGQLTAYIKKKFDTDTTKSHTIEPDGKDIYPRYFEHVGLIKPPAEAFSDYKLSHVADDKSNVADMWQKGFCKIDISNYIVADVADVADEMRNIVSEIEKMYSFISLCESPREITYENYLKFSVTTATSATIDREMAVSDVADRFDVALEVSHDKKRSATIEPDLSPHSPVLGSPPHQTIDENLAEAARREAEHLEHFKTPEPARQKTYLALQDVPTFTDGDGRSWTLKKGDLVSGLPDLLVRPLIKRDALKEVTPPS